MKVPEHLRERPYVVDRLPRLLMQDFDYGTVAWPDHDLCMLEWDVALDGPSRNAFTQFAAEEPNRVATGAYYLNEGRWLTTGMGCIYLPIVIVKEFLSTSPERWTDGMFLVWYLEQYGEYRVCPQVYPQHLNS